MTSKNLSNTGEQGSRSPGNFKNHPSYDPLLTRDEVAEYLRIKYQTLSVWAQKQKEALESERIPITYVGTRPRYRLSDVNQYIEEGYERG